MLCLQRNRNAEAHRQDQCPSFGPTMNSIDVPSVRERIEEFWKVARKRLRRTASSMAVENTECIESHWTN